MNAPGATNKTIADLIPGVLDALQQRTDVAAIAPKYIKRALQEITESYPFEELRTTGTTVLLTAKKAIYPVSFFLNAGDDYTSNEVFTLFVDPPANQTDYTLDYMTPKAIEPMMSPSTQGIPKWWSRWGTNYHFGPVPNQAYSIFLRYQFRHPFPDDVNALGRAPIFIPDTWEEIVEYAAAMRIALVKRWNDQWQAIHQILYGDPEFVASEGKRGQPGLIAARVPQVQRDQRFNSRKLGIVVGRYGTR